MYLLRRRLEPSRCDRCTDQGQGPRVLCERRRPCGTVDRSTPGQVATAHSFGDVLIASDGPGRKIHLPLRRFICIVRADGAAVQGPQLTSVSEGGLKTVSSHDGFRQVCVRCIVPQPHCMTPTRTAPPPRRVPQLGQYVGAGSSHPRRVRRSFILESYTCSNRVVPRFRRMRSATTAESRPRALPSAADRIATHDML